MGWDQATFWVDAAIFILLIGWMVQDRLNFYWRNLK